MNSCRILFTKTDESISIKIPLTLLRYAAENNSEYPVIIKNEHKFAEKVLFNLENNLGQPESGLTGFQELIDRAIFEATEDGENFAEFKQL